MPDVVKKAEETVTKPISWAKSNPWAMAFLIVVVVILAMRFSGKMQTFLATKAAGGSKVWRTVAKIAGVAVATVVMCMAGQALGFDVGHQAILDGGIAALASAVAFPASDFCALKDEQDNFTSLITPGTAPKERVFTFKAERETYAGFPIKATDLVFALKMGLVQSGESASLIP
jgi:hypothetical protein